MTLLTLLTLFAYVPGMQGGFVWDDDYYVEKNPTLRSLDGLRRIWIELGATPQYYPLVHTSFWLEYHTWGLNPAGYHAVNVALHAVNAALLWRVLLLLGIPGAWVAAAVFAVHPVHVESVAWITERKNVLSGLFYLASAFTYLRYARISEEGSSRRPLRWFFLTVVLFVCALLSKTVTATLPAALLLLLWWKRGRWVRRDLAELLPLFPIGLALGLLTAFMEKRVVGAVGADWNLTFLDRSLLAGRAVWFYAQKLLLPLELCFIYPRWIIDHGLWWQYLYPLAALLTLTLVWSIRHRIGRGALIAALFFCGTLFPALGFFDVYPMRYSWVADHFQYLASIGLIAALVAGLHSLLGRFRSQAPRFLVAAAVLLTLGSLTWRQCFVYHDLKSLWTDTLKKNPDAWLAHNNLGNLLREQGNDQIANDHIEKAMAHFREAMRLNPRDAYAYNNMGGLLLGLGRLDECIRVCEDAIRLEPNYADAHRNLAVALAARGRIADAIIHCRLSLKARPDDPDVLNNLAWMLVTCSADELRNEREGLQLARRAAQLTINSNSSVLDTLAAAQAANGDYQQAVDTAQRARTMLQTTHNIARMAAIDDRIRIYQLRKPYREPPPASGPTR